MKSGKSAKISASDTFSVSLAFILWPPGSGFNDSWGLGEGVGAHPLVGELYGVLPSTVLHRSAPFNMRWMLMFL